MIHRHIWKEPEEYVAPEHTDAFPSGRSWPKKTTLVYRCSVPNCTAKREEKFEGERRD